MRPWLLKLASGVCVSLLLLTLATTLAGVRRPAKLIGWDNDDPPGGVGRANGELLSERGWFRFVLRLRRTKEHPSPSQPIGLPFMELLHWRESGGLQVGWQLRVHAWLIAVTLGTVIGALVFTPWRARRRGRGSLCTSCGYDVRATPDRCPECGAAVPREPPHNPPMHRTGPAA